MSGAQLGVVVTFMDHASKDKAELQNALFVDVGSRVYFVQNCTAADDPIVSDTHRELNRLIAVTTQLYWRVWVVHRSTIHPSSWRG